MAAPAYSFVIPTYKRPDVLADCLRHICELDYDLKQIEVIIVDNGEKENSSDVGDLYADRIRLSYVVNPVNLGPGGSLNKGLGLSRGTRIIVSNDDAMVPRNFLSRCDEIFESDANIGCVGFRAIEEQYAGEGDGIGVIDPSGAVIGNFNRATEGVVDVQHVYGFCYAITRHALDKAGAFDHVLLAKKYASGNRIETDHCLEMKRCGFRVVYDGETGIPHLAKPRLDISERSLKWRLNDVRNTLYLFLKHYGPIGNGGLALRYALLHDLGMLSLVKRPSLENARYAAMGIRGRVSAFGHWIVYLVTKRSPASNGEVSD